MSYREFKMLMIGYQASGVVNGIVIGNFVLFFVSVLFLLLWVILLRIKN